jgi:hypothetical protein
MSPSCDRMSWFADTVRLISGRGNLLRDRALKFSIEDLANRHRRTQMGRGILLWMLGVPIPVILLLAMCSHH